jgi:hypothetical protein
VVREERGKRKGGVGGGGGEKGAVMVCARCEGKGKPGECRSVGGLSSKWPRCQRRCP